MRKHWIALFAALLLVVGIVLGAQAADFQIHAPKAGVPFSLKDAKGSTVALKDFNGKYMLQVYTAAGDGYGKALLNNLKKDYAADMQTVGVQVLITLVNGTASEAMEMAGDYPGFKVAILPMAQISKVLGKQASMFGVKPKQQMWYPVIFLHNKSGQIIYHYISVEKRPEDLIGGDKDHTPELMDMVIREACGNKPLSVTLDQAGVELSLTKNPTAQLTATQHYGESKLTWKSSDKEVVTVSKTGKLTAKAPGTAMITVTTANGKKAFCEVTVTVPSVELKSIDAGKKGQMKLNIKASEKLKGFEATYAMSGTSDWQTVTLKKSSQSAVITLKNLVSGSMYRVKVRGYAVVKGKTIYTEWTDMEYFEAE